MLLTSEMTAQSYAPAPGQNGSTAISKDSAIIQGWAISCAVTRGYKQIDHPEYGFVDFGNESNGTGPAEGNSLDIVSLGDGGSAVLAFNPPIKNESGPDFAVFENGFWDHYMELAFVEVSSNGVDYFRFPSHSETPLSPQMSNASYGNCAYIHNLAGKYRQGFGTPFDLADLDSIIGLDLNSISFVRLMDVVGNINSTYGTTDFYGNIINDPWPTNFASGGFDLDGIAVINEGVLSISEQQLTFDIYPNPFFDKLKINIVGKAQIEIFNYSGSSVYESVLSGENMISLQNLESGVYFVRITNELGSQVVKLQKHE